MTEIHLHLHIPPGAELHFDGETLTCKPAVEITGKSGDVEVSVSVLESALAAMREKGGTDSAN
jgi:hypothetical protein